MANFPKENSSLYNVSKDFVEESLKNYNQNESGMDLGKVVIDDFLPTQNQVSYLKQAIYPTCETEGCDAKATHRIIRNMNGTETFWGSYCEICVEIKIDELSSEK